MPNTQNPTSKSQVTFWQVNDAQSKLTCVCQLIYRHFQQAQRQLITVPSQAAAEYLDKVLWRYPPEAFIPHAISTTPVPAAIVITTASENLNNATVLINLCPTPSPLVHNVALVHELLDCSDPSKQQASRQRFAAYQEQGHNVSSQNWVG